MQTVEFDRLLEGGERVLDVGCGEGRHCHAAALHESAAATVVGLDLDRERLRSAREQFADLAAWEPESSGEADPRAPDAATGSQGDADAGGAAVAGDGGTATTTPAFLSANALSLPFPDGAFDVVVCSEVLEHLPDYEPAIEELVRVLKPGGRLAASVPRYGPERVCWALSDEYHAVEGGHVRIFRRDQLESAFEARDLVPTGAHHAHALHSPYWWLKCLWWDREERGDPPLPLRAYDRFMDWTVLNETPLVDALEDRLDPLLGKSLVLYYRKERPS